MPPTVTAAFGPIRPQSFATMLEAYMKADPVYWNRYSAASVQTSATKSASTRPATSLLPSVSVLMFAVLPTAGVHVERSPWLFQKTCKPLQSAKTKRSLVTNIARIFVGMPGSEEATTARGHGWACVGSNE